MALYKGKPRGYNRPERRGDGMELLDIVDENGVPTGAVIDRETAHRLVIRHRTAHVWLARMRDGKAELLLQKRSENKDSHPGCYDISSAGHIPAGQDDVPSALRELKEELGLTARPDELLDCGLRQFQLRASFHGRPFCDDQVSRVFLLWRDVEPEALSLQASEVESARWMDFDACLAMARSGEPANCVYEEELRMLAPQLAKGERK